MEIIICDSDNVNAGKIKDICFQYSFQWEEESEIKNNKCQRRNVFLYESLQSDFSYYCGNCDCKRRDDFRKAERTVCTCNGTYTRGASKSGVSLFSSGRIVGKASKKRKAGTFTQ